MAPTSPSAAPRTRSAGGLLIGLGLVAALLFFAISGAVAYRNIALLRDVNRAITRSHDVIVGFDGLLSSAADAETGQRGYLLTGQPQYLAPYYAAKSAIAAKLAEVADLIGDNAAQRASLTRLRSHFDAKLSELQETIDLRRTGGLDAALAVVESGRGKAAMDAIRAELRAMDRVETEQRARRLADAEVAYRSAIVSSLLSALLGAALAALIGYLVRRAALARRLQEWLQEGQVALGARMLGEQTAAQLGDSVLTFLARYLGAQAGAVYVGAGATFSRVAVYGAPADAPIPASFARRDGLLGQAVVEGRNLLIEDAPEGYLAFGSALGRGKPRHIVIAPARIEGAVNAVIELGFVRRIEDSALALLDLMSESIATAVRSANYRADLQRLLEETQRQSEELQVQSEELRVSNEELEEQSRALKESQSRLEQSQAELEQNNTQLEEQAQQLEAQRDGLERANAAIAAKARDLAQASRYKSDFLANMSHELRTPLNSSLILAKLLADNPQGNLTEEQVKFARTIQSSGNDLLNLINDILDLSKIEAGHVEIRPESVSLKRLARDMQQMFEPLASQKGLAFSTELAPDLPDMVTTDPQRLQQILKNLLANALKFTEKGSVRLVVSAGADQLAFSVVDTGIGIPEEHRQSIFDSFRQADGTISRRYGGTGLGLSISRKLARLLRGSIRLESREGEGSTFTVSLPLTYQPSAAPAREIRPPPAPAAPAPLQTIDDDRDQISEGRRALLIVEDDAAFAAILRDLAHEMGFQALVANAGEEALALAKRHMPSAIVLDVGLPDQSGLAVLDRLKRDVATRHIPIHVVSGSDHAETALALGAVGYMLKPVQREELADVLAKLEAKLSQRMHRVLVVEDDPVQREAIGRLLSSQDVETVGAGSAADCLARLKEQTFDCMVLDLALPDASGYNLLETLSREDAYAFPPVIVYTGRDLSDDDEHRLRRYSKSIIIKGAKSPERLLDEVTLFLHQVVSDLPDEQQKMIRRAHNRDDILEGRRILIVEDDVRNVYALSNILEPRGAVVEIARNGREALDRLAAAEPAIDLVLMDVMMPVMDGLTATREIRQHPQWRKLPIIALTAKAMPDDQQNCLAAGASDYIAKPLDVERLLSLVRVWLPRYSR